MNGFSNDVVSMLKHSYMYHGESIGLVIGNNELASTLESLGLLVSVDDKLSDNWDYIVVSGENVGVRVLIKCLTQLRNCGIIILELTNKPNVKKYADRYSNASAGFYATKVMYDDRVYLIIHQGYDYGN